MFNRTLQVRMVKNDRDETKTPNTNDHHFEGRTAILGHHLTEGIKTIGKMILIYIAADTIRQVAIEKAKK